MHLHFISGVHASTTYYNPCIMYRSQKTPGTIKGFIKIIMYIFVKMEIVQKVPLFHLRFLNLTMYYHPCIMYRSQTTQGTAMETIQTFFF